MKYKFLISSAATLLYAAPSIATHFTLQNQTDINSPTLVTTGIPFAPGELNNIAELKLFNESGVEIPIFIEPTLTWHFHETQQQSIRSVKIQFQVDSVTDNNNEFTWQINQNTPIERLQEFPIESGLMVNTNPIKSGVKHPKVIAVHSPDYLASAGIIPNFIPMRADWQELFWNAQYDWAKDLDYSQSYLANWLFDRPTSLYKGCMRTGDVKCYIEAYSSFNFWMNNLKRDGDYRDCKGGSLLSSTTKACDTKYTYIEPLKIHLALTGDDSKFDQEFIKSLAELSEKQFYYQTNYRDEYNAESEPFTERGAGISLLAQLNAYELTGDQNILASVNDRIDALYKHSVNSNPDNLPVDGSWRHSWTKHEGASYPGDGDLDDRRFSPWMMENITDALWQTYQVIKDPRIEDMLAKSASALLKWGYNDSTGYNDRIGSSIKEYARKTWTHSCNVTKTSLLYSASSTANPNSIITTQNNDGWYSDSHNPESILTLALGVFFTTNPQERELLIEKVESIEAGYLNSTCGAIKNTKRKFNWNNRSNYWGTYLWVMNELGRLPPLPENRETNSPTPPSENEGIPQIDINYQHSFVDSMNDGLSNVWAQTSGWLLQNDALMPVSSGLMYWDKSISTGEAYTVSVSLNTELDTIKTSAALIFNGKDNSDYYTARIKAGEYGYLAIYHHTASWDLGGELVAIEKMPITFTGSDTLFAMVHEGKAIIGLNEIQYLAYSLPSVVQTPIVGLLASGSNTTYGGVSKFSVEYNSLNDTPKVFINDDFYTNESHWKANSIWNASEGTLISTKDSQYFLKALTPSQEYSVNTTLLDSTSYTGNLGIIAGEGINSGKHYSVRFKTGQWGAIYIYSHDYTYGGGTLIHTLSINIPESDSYQLRVLVQENLLTITLDGLHTLIFDAKESIINNKVGLINISNGESRANFFSYE